MRYFSEGLKRKVVTSAICVLSVLVFCNVPSLGRPLRTNDLMPDIRLPVPRSEQHKHYLGLRDSEDFFLEEIKARFLIIEIYTMY